MFIQFNDDENTNLNISKVMSTKLYTNVISVILEGYVTINVDYSNHICTDIESDYTKLTNLLGSTIIKNELPKLDDMLDDSRAKVLAEQVDCLIYGDYEISTRMIHDEKYSVDIIMPGPKIYSYGEDLNDAYLNLKETIKMKILNGKTKFDNDDIMIAVAIGNLEKKKIEYKKDSNIK